MLFFKSYPKQSKSATKSLVDTLKCCHTKSSLKSFYSKSAVVLYIHITFLVFQILKEAELNRERHGGGKEKFNSLELAFRITSFNPYDNVLNVGMVPV